MGKSYKKRGRYRQAVIDGKQVIRKLQEFCDICPDYVGTVYRHIGFSQYGTTGLKKARNILDWFKDNQGGMFSNKTFWSTSNNAKLEYGGIGELNIDFKIKSKTGTVLNGLNKIIGKNGIREDEILFPPDTQFKITKTKEIKKTKTFDDGYKYEYTTLEVTLEEI